MQNVNTAMKGLLLAAMVIALVDVSGAGAETTSWKAETVLVSPRGDQTVVRSFRDKTILFKNADPQLAMEWGMANAHTTVVLAGKYVVSDRIDVPRDSVTLIIDRGAVISLNPETKHSTIPFRGGKGYWGIIPLIFNLGHDNVRVINFGRLAWFCRAGERHGTQTFPIMFRGAKGGMMLVCGSPDQACWLIDCQDVQVPLVIQDGGTGAEPFGMEGCVNCKLGMVVNLPERNRDPKSQPPRYWMERGKPRPMPWWPPEGMTHEALDLNSSNRGITIERVVAERHYVKPPGQRTKGWGSCEIVDCNASQATVGEIVLAGELGHEYLHLCTKGSGPRFTSRERVAARLVVGKEGQTCSKMECLGKGCNGGTILEDATATVREDVPKLPDALPRFTVKATVEITLKDGSKKKYTKEVAIDVRASQP